MITLLKKRIIFEENVAYNINEESNMAKKTILLVIFRTFRG